MYLKHLALTNFRNYARLEIDLQARVHVFQGENAQGKTNLLEAIYYLATTKSPLASSDREIMAWAADAEIIPHTYIKGGFFRASEEHTIEVTLVKERQPGNGVEDMRFRRQILLDGVSRRAVDVVGKLNVVLFLPEDIALVAGAPGERRHYLDVTLCQIDPQYCRQLWHYNRVLAQRNALLRQIREGHARPDELDYWDEQLAHTGAYVLLRRGWAIDELGKQVKEIQPALTGGQETLVLAYISSVARHAQAQMQSVLPDMSDEAHLVETFRQVLHLVRREELGRAVTVVGPHRDDFAFLVNGIDMSVYGSRGQQRTVALALKLAEVALMRAETGEMPVLLLDDVISELDRQRCEFLLQTVTGAQQVLITTTDLNLYRRDFADAAILWHVAAGSVSPLS
jgi:DNA replication and repair protein RecF